MTDDNVFDGRTWDGKPQVCDNVIPFPARGMRFTSPGADRIEKSDATLEDVKQAVWPPEFSLYVVVGPSGRPLTKPLSKIQAEHCAAEWNDHIKREILSPIYTVQAI